MIARMKKFSETRRGRFWDLDGQITPIFWVTGGVLVLASALLTFLAARSTIEWRNGASTLIERRAEEGAAILVKAVTRDMQGVHASVLMPMAADRLTLETPSDLSDTVAEA